MKSFPINVCVIMGRQHIISINFWHAALPLYQATNKTSEQKVGTLIKRTLCVAANLTYTLKTVRFMIIINSFWHLTVCYFNKNIKIFFPDGLHVKKLSPLWNEWIVIWIRTKSNMKIISSGYISVFIRIILNWSKSITCLMTTWKHMFNK